MSCLWDNHNNSQVFLDVVVLPADLDEPVESSPQWPDEWTFKALVDTGATLTGITAKAADEIGLHTAGEGLRVRGVTGVTELKRYVFRVGFRRPETDEYERGEAGSVAMLGREICGFELAPIGDFDVLLGMDIISTGSLKVEGNGTFSFSF